MHSIEEAFGEGCDLYKDVLNCAKDADKAALRKAYYRTALQYHPDKNLGDASAAAKFQAVTAAYQILLDVDLRAAYDESGEIPSDGPVDDDNNDNQWKDFFDRIFGKVTVGDIEAFAAKYKCSDEEKRDVLKEYTARKGNLVKMLEFVMLSEARDAQRWVEDYLRPAIETKEISSSFADAMEKTLKKLQKKVEQEDAKTNDEEENDEGSAQDNDDVHDDDETEVEDYEDETPPSHRKRRRAEPVEAKSKTKSPPKKSKASKGKSKDNDTDLVAMIRNKNRAGGGMVSTMASLGARYGVSLEDDDPINDKDFAKAQSKLKGRKSKFSKKA